MQRAREIVCICVGESGHACLHPLRCLYVCERASGYVDVCMFLCVHVRTWQYACVRLPLPRCHAGRRLVV